MDDKRFAFAWMKGFSHSAGIRAIPEDLPEDESPHFYDGWKHGKIALAEAAAHCEKKYATTFLTIKANENPAQSR